MGTSAEACAPPVDAARVGAGDATGSPGGCGDPVGLDDPSGIAFGADQVWVANRRDGTVSTIDPQSDEVGTLRLGFRPAAVAVEEGAVWVALAA